MATTMTLADAIIAADPRELLLALTGARRPPTNEERAAIETRLRARAAKMADEKNGKKIKVRTGPNQVIEGTIFSVEIAQIEWTLTSARVVFGVRVLGPDGRTIWGPFNLTKLPR